METIKELREICQGRKKRFRSPSGWGYLGHRYLSIYVTKAILRLSGNKIKPNYISIFNILFGIIILVFLALLKTQLSFIFLLFLFYFSFLLDKVDGEIARYQGLVTLRGMYLDEIYHLFVQNGLILALGISRSLVFLGIAGFFLFFLGRYVRKVKYFIYAKYKSCEEQFSIKKDLGRVEKVLAGFLNMFPLKLCSISRRHDIFLFLVLLLSIFYFNSSRVWLWFLIIWLVISMVYVLRFLLLNYLFIDRDIQLIDKDKL